MPNPGGQLALLVAMRVTMMTGEVVSILGGVLWICWLIYLFLAHRGYF